MAGKLDIDDPDEVIAAVGRVATAIAAADGRVLEVAAALVPTGVIRAPVDCDLVDVTRTLETAFAEAVRCGAPTDDEALRRTVATVQALAAADRAGGAAVDGAGV